MAAEMRVYQAIAVSPGVAVGRVRRLRHFNRAQSPELRKIQKDEAAGVLKQFRTAVKTTSAELDDLQKAVRKSLAGDEAEIFEAHKLMLNDKAFLAGVEKLISEELMAPECAVFQTAERFASAMDAVNDEYLRERAADIRDVSSRLIANLSDTDLDRSLGPDTRRIIVASMLSPSETAHLDQSRVLGFAVVSGSVTSHTAILARSMHLPAVVGLDKDLLEALNSNDTLIVDGFSGKVIVNPDPRTEETYRLKRENAGQFFNRLLKERDLHPETTDGFVIPLAANVNEVERASQLREYGAFGIGLFRTEFLFLNRQTLPDEEEQFEIYKSLLIRSDDRPVVVRTLDVGGDKGSSAIYHAEESNPFLGLRGIRLCLNERRDVFRTQLRALLRAGIYGNLRVMLPMISSLEEVIETRSLIDELQNELRSEGREFAAQPVLGAMIETPAAAVIADSLARYVDFFSIGTNDLVQYTLAIDRSNDRVAYLYRPSHPAVLELIRHCVAAAGRHGLWVGVCGQAAADPLMVPLLIGLGVQELSMDVDSIGLIRRVIRSISMQQARLTAAEALNCGSAAEAAAVAEKLLRKTCPEVMEIQ